MILERNDLVMIILLLFNRQVLCFFEQNDLVTTLVIFTHFVLAFICKLNVLFMCSIYVVEEMTSVEKTSIILFGIKEKQLCCENSLYCVYYCQVNDHGMKPFNTYQSLSFDVYLYEKTSIPLNFQRVQSVGQNLCHYKNLLTCICIYPLSVFVFSPVGIALRMFYMHQYLVCIRQVRNGTVLPLFVPTS